VGYTELVQPIGQLKKKYLEMMQSREFEYKETFYPVFNELKNLWRILETS